MPLPVTLDHCVIHVTDWERSNAFYTDVLGAELVARPVGFAYRFGDRQLNVHGPGVAPAEVARLPVLPGNSDLCFEWNGPIADAIAHLERCGVAVEAGPDAAFRRQGRGHERLFPRSGRLADGIHFLRAAIRASRPREAPGKHDPNVLPSDIPVPQDDGAARHLPGTGVARSGAAGDARRRLQCVDAWAAAPCSTFIRAPACPASICRRAGTIFPARAAARRNPAASATILPSSKRSASRMFSACRRRTRTISARPPSGCICRFRFCRMPS